MGREIRMVPPNHEHPRYDHYNTFSGKTENRYQPKFERNYSEVCAEYVKSFKEFYEKSLNLKKNCEFWEYEGNPPTREYYISYDKKDATWFQLYETVSEGTPVSPPFETKQELADYLAVNGDFWDQKRRKEGNSVMNCQPWGKENAEKFVFGSGYMPSMIITGGKIISGGDLASELK